MSKNWTEEELNKLKELYYNGISYKEISESLQVEEHDVNNLIYSKKWANRTRHWSKEEIQNIKELYNSGYSQKEIAKRINRKYTSVKNIISKRKISTNEIIKNSQKVKELTEIQKSYIAGIIDGEGTIGISKRTTSLDNGEINPIYCVFMKVPNTDPNLIKYMKETTGVGSISIRESKGNKRDCYGWGIGQTASLQLLEQINKYLVIKKKQSDLVFNLRETYQNFYGINKTPKHIVDTREQLYIKLKELHHEKFENIFA